MCQDTTTTYNLPPFDEVREDLAQRFSQVLRSEPSLAIGLGIRPWGLGGEEKLLLRASVCPRDSGLEFLGSRLFDREPSVGKRLRIISDET